MRKLNNIEKKLKNKQLYEAELIKSKAFIVQVQHNFSGKTGDKGLCKQVIDTGTYLLGEMLGKNKNQLNFVIHTSESTDIEINAPEYKASDNQNISYFKGFNIFNETKKSGFETKSVNYFETPDLQKIFNYGFYKYNSDNNILKPIFLEEKQCRLLFII